MRTRTSGLLLLVGTLALSACSGPATVAAPQPTPIISRLELRDALRTLWVAHVTRTRVYLMSALGGLADTDSAAANLLQNLIDLGDALKPFYGDAAGDALTALLVQHVNLAVEVVFAAKTGDSAGFAAANGRWASNADAIATFLAGVNPGWAEADLKQMLRLHLEQALAETTARLGGDWQADLRAHDVVVVHIRSMADTLSSGIAAQFPKRVSSETLTAVSNPGLHVAMRALWADHAAWTRVYLVSEIGLLPDASFAATRLLQNQTDIGNAIKPWYGEAAGDELAALLREHIALAAEAVVAARASDDPRVADARARWNANAEAIAHFLARTNPSWPLDELTSMMRTHLELTWAEANARLTGDWAGDLDAWQAAAVHVQQFADLLSDGISARFPGLN